jgi:hypothetical protein
MLAVAAVEAHVRMVGRARDDRGEAGPVDDHGGGVARVEQRQRVRLQRARLVVPRAVAEFDGHGERGERVERGREPILHLARVRDRGRKLEQHGAQAARLAQRLRDPRAPRRGQTRARLGRRARHRVVRQVLRRLERKLEPGPVARAGDPAPEQGGRRIAVERGVDLQRGKTLRQEAEPLRGRQALGVDDALPVLVAPARGPDEDRHRNDISGG